MQIKSLSALKYLGHEVGVDDLSDALELVNLHP